MGPRTEQVIALWHSGELAKAASASRNRAETAERLGMTDDGLKHALERARNHGYAIPDFRGLQLAGRMLDTSGAKAANDECIQREDFADEEPTQARGQAPVRPDDDYAAWDASRASISGSEQTASATGKWPHVEAFDVVGDTMLPAHGPGVRRSTLVGPDGPILQWIKNPGGASNDEIYEAAKRGLADGPRAEPVEPPQYAAEDLLSCIVVGDAHFGMLAWGRECGESFDLDIAERDLLAAVARLVALAPHAAQAILCNIGDFIHADSDAGTTTKGTRVDVDTRWPRVVETAIRAKRQCISGLLTKSKHVHDINVRGNHDSISSVVMSIALAQFYENEPRVTVDTSPGLFNYYRFGQNLLGFHHGHTTKPVGLAGVMATRRAKDWGETRYRRWYNGHFHSQRVHEVNGCIVEHVPTLAALDAWAAGQGYDALREIRLDVFHREHGLINRHIVNVEQVRTQENACASGSSS